MVKDMRNVPNALGTRFFDDAQYEVIVLATIEFGAEPTDFPN
jgi:hypothetical protein